MYRLGHATQTDANVWVRHTSGGVISLVVDGRSFTGTTIDIGTGDGTGTVTATGLAANTKYPFDLYVGGALVHNGILKTMPRKGDSFSLLWAYCWHPFRPCFAINQAIEKYNDIAAFLMGGDNIYSDADTSTITRESYGENLKNIGAILLADPDDTNAALLGLRAMYRSRFKEHGTKKAIESFPTYPVISDHDMQTGNNWDVNHSLTEANQYIAWASTQEQAIAVNEIHKQAFWEYYSGTPQNTDANNESSRPVNEQFYFDFVIGDAHIFCLDANNYRDRILDVDYGSQQMSWITSRLSASLSKWKIICTGDGITGHTASPSADHQAIIDHISNNGLTGCLMVTGDIHTPFYGEYGIPVVRGGPVSQYTHLTITDGYQGGTRYKYLGYYSNGVDKDAGIECVTVLKVTNDYLDIDYLSDRGDVFFSRRLFPGSNELSVHTTRFG